jgi:mono/diheme cytochrome c family protein
VRGSAALLGAAALAAVAAGAGASAQSTAESDYVLQCRGCHGPEGKGVSGLVPALDEMDTLLATTQGRVRLLEVPGVRQASLSDARLAALLNWAAARFGDEPARPISAEEVARLRAPTRAQR